MHSFFYPIFNQDLSLVDRITIHCSIKFELYHSLIFLLLQFLHLYFIYFLFRLSFLMFYPNFHLIFQELIFFIPNFYSEYYVVYGIFSNLIIIVTNLEKVQKQSNPLHPIKLVHSILSCLFLLLLLNM